MGVLDNIAGAGAGTAIGAGMGLLTGNLERDKASEQNQEYINQQTEASMKMTKFNREQQMQMWKDTNYKAQVDEMKKAGLNVGMMYGMGGGGGTSSAVATGGVPSGGAGSGRKDVADGMGIALQTALTQAQTELMKVQKEKTEGVDTNKVVADTQKTIEDTKSAELQNKWEQFIQDVDKSEGTDGTPLKERTYRLENNERIGRILNLEQAFDKMGVDMDKGQAEIDRIKADTEIQRQLKEYREQLNPVELDKLKSELEVYKKNPANNEIVQWIKEILGIGSDFIKKR